MADQYRLYRHPNGVYYHRVKVPSDVRDLYGREIAQRSLKTRDFRTAVRLLPSVIVEFDQQFARLRAACTDGGRLTGAELGNHHKSQSQSASSNVPSTRRDLKRESSNCLSDLEVPSFETHDLPRLSVLAEECFVAVGREKRWSIKTRAARRTQIKQIIEICGDKPLNRYTQHDFRTLKSLLFALPPQSHGKKCFQEMSKRQVAERARLLGVPGLSSESVRQIMTSANIVFGWARSEYDHSLRNIVQPMVPPPSGRGHPRDRRSAFTNHELQRIFNHPVFTGVESDRNWMRPGAVPLQHTGRFWVPLLSLFSGTRLMEAVQLCREDVRCEHEIWFIDINDNASDTASKRLKNASSVRRIPLHPALIELGFLDFVSAIGAGERLFADLAIGPAVQRHRSASRIFNRLLQSAGVKGPGKVWHSLRHTFEQACRDSRVDSAIMDQLQGHAQKGMRATYGSGYELPALNDGVRSLRYDGLDLSHIAPFNHCDSQL